MENNVNCEEMIFLIRNLVYAEDAPRQRRQKFFLKPAAHGPWGRWRRLPQVMGNDGGRDSGLKICQYFPKEEGMMQHIDGRYFPQ